jgi:GNAT superfamily N-acetyltransferase
MGFISESTISKHHKSNFLEFALKFQEEKIKIAPLTDNTLKDATSLRDSIFDDIDPLDIKTLKASLNPKKYKKWFKDIELIKLNYWLAIDKTNNVMGMVGLYNEIEDNKDMCWLGWFCVDPKHREQGVGKKLLEFSIARAKQENKKYLHLYTQDLPEYRSAIKMYKEYGFKFYEPEEKDDNDNIYFLLELK